MFDYKIRKCFECDSIELEFADDGAALYAITIYVHTRIYVPRSLGRSELFDSQFRSVRRLDSEHAAEFVIFFISFYRERATENLIKMNERENMK